MVVWFLKLIKLFLINLCFFVLSDDLVSSQVTPLCTYLILSLTDRESASASAAGKGRRPISDRWESQLWKEKKFALIDHLHYSHVYPESIPRKFIFEQRKFLTEQFNSQPAKYIPPEGRPPNLDDFKSARSLGHFEVTILGKWSVLFCECH